MAKSYSNVTRKVQKSHPSILIDEKHLGDLYGFMELWRGQKGKEERQSKGCETNEIVERLRCCTNYTKCTKRRKAELYERKEKYITREVSRVVRK